MKRIIMFVVAILIMVSRAIAQAPASSAVPPATTNRGTDFVNLGSPEEILDKLTPYLKVIVNNVVTSTNNNGYQLNIALIALKDSTKWVNTADYLRRGNRFLRNTQFSLATAQKKTYNDATLQLTFALLNRRDSAVFVYLNPLSDGEFLNLLRAAKRQYKAELSTKDTATAESKSSTAYVTETQYLMDPKNKRPDPAFELIVNQLLQKSAILKGTTLLEAWQLGQKQYKDFAKQVQRRPLLTLYPYTSFDYVYTGFDKLGIGSTLLVSLDKNIADQPLQLDVEGNFYKGRDSLEKKVNMGQSIAALSIGVNYVFKADSKGKSKFEAKFSGTFQHNWETDSKQKTPTADLTLRYNLAKNFWIPVDFQYDSTRKGLFGYVSITCNLFK